MIEREEEGRKKEMNTGLFHSSAGLDLLRLLLSLKGRHRHEERERDQGKERERELLVGAFLRSLFSFLLCLTLVY